MRVYSLLPQILNMSLTAAIVTVIVLLVRLPLRKAPKIFSYVLWAVVLFRLVCPISFSSELSLFSIFSAPAATNGGIAYIPSDFVRMGAPQTDMSVSGIGKAINDNLPQGGEQPASTPPKPRLAAAAALWLAGIAAMLIYSAVSLLLLRRRLVGAVRLRGNIYLADHIATPFAIGVLRPKIYLPSSLGEQEQGYIILHEQTHIRRWDHIVKLIAFLALSIHWFNPFVWAAFVCCIKDMEMSCDERVIKEMGGEIKGAYSTSLLKLAAGRRLINGSPLAFGEGSLKGRIRNVMSFKKPGFWVLIVTTAVVVTAAVCLLANPPKAGTTEKPASSSSVTAFSLAPAYSFDKCLYMNPLSSYYPFDTTGQLYLFNPEGIFTIISEETGEIQESVSLIDWTGNEVDDKDWNSLFDFGDPVDISSYSVRRQYRAADKYRIYQMDDEVWLAAVNKGSLWSLYRLKETAKPDIAGGSGASAAESGLAASGSEPASSELQPASPAISLEQEAGADMAELDYASDNIVIFHGYFGLFVYHLDSNKIVRSLDLKPIGCNATQGDSYCEATVSPDGNTVQLHPMNSKDMYVYTVSDNTLQKTAYKRMENRFADFVDITDVIDLQEAGSCSHSAVKFDTGEYGYLRTSDWTVGTLTYVRGGDTVYRLFDSGVSGEQSSAAAAEPSFTEPAEPSSEAAQTVEPSSEAAQTAEPWERVSRAFAEAFFKEDEKAMKSYLVDPDEGFDRYNLDKGLGDAGTMKLKFDPDRIKNDSASVEYEFRFEGDDSLSYLSLSMIKIDDVWKIEFYGLEK